MKIWIPGGQGAVGKALQQLCKQQNLPFIVTRRQDVDISSLLQIKNFFYKNRDITHLINCAAYTRVDEAEIEREEAHKTNALGPENLGILAHQQGLKLVHLSTDYVFNSDTPSALVEETPYSPLSVYAQTKHEGEERLLNVLPRACIVRTSWVFGVEGKNFIASLWNKLQEETKILIVHDQVNRLTYGPDLAATLLALLYHEGIYHFANHGVTSRYEVALKMKQFLQEQGRECPCHEIVPISAATLSLRALRPCFSVLDTKKIEKILSLSPRTWEEALKEFVYEQLS